MSYDDCWARIGECPAGLYEDITQEATNGKREAAVFHAMEGTLSVNAKHKRLAEISGHLAAGEVRGQVIGHLDADGQFYVEQEEVNQVIRNWSL